MFTTSLVFRKALADSPRNLNESPATMISVISPLPCLALSPQPPQEQIPHSMLHLTAGGSCEHGERISFLVPGKGYSNIRTILSRCLHNRSTSHLSLSKR